MSGVGRKQALRSILSEAIIELCRREAFYIAELRIEGTICVVSDRSSALIIHLTEQVSDKSNTEVELNDNQDTPNSVFNVADDAGDIKEVEELADERNDFMSEEAQIHQMAIKAGLVERLEGKYNCPFCPKRYRFKHSLKDHINKHTGNRPHQCKHCSLRFIHLSSLCAHVRRRHSQVRVANFQCDICQDVFATEQFLKQHHTWKHKEGRAKPAKRGSASKDQNTPLLGNIQGNSDSVIRWNDIPGNNNDAQQSFCDGVARNRSQPAPHFDNISNNNNNNENNAENINNNINTSCNINNKTDEQEDGGQEKHNFQQIKLEPGGSTPGNHSLNKSSLNNQFQQYSSPINRNNNFNFFPTSSPNNNNNLPSNVHNYPGTPGWQGGLPTSAYSENSSLRRAMNGKFQCPHCEKSYNFKHTLKEHLNKHLGRRPNICKHCGDSFIHLASLCAHIKRAHDEHMPTDFVCRICNEKLMNYQSLKQHYTWRHREAKLLIEANSQALSAAGISSSANLAFLNNTLNSNVGLERGLTFNSNNNNNEKNSNNNNNSNLNNDNMNVPNASNAMNSSIVCSNQSNTIGNHDISNLDLKNNSINNNLNVNMCSNIGMRSNASVTNFWQQKLMTAQHPNQKMQHQQQLNIPTATTSQQQHSQILMDTNLQQQQQQQQLLLNSMTKDDYSGNHKQHSHSPANILKELDFLQGFETFAQSIGVNMGLDQLQQSHFNSQSHSNKQPPDLNPSLLLKDHP